MKKLVFAIMLLVLSTSFTTLDEWTPLLDRDLTQWETYLSFRHSSEYNGDAPKDSRGELIKPIGYNADVTHVFSTVEEQGEVLLKVSGEIYGCIYTKNEYDNFHLRLKVKWGTTKFQPRQAKLRDSGILYYSIGESGVDYWRAWMLSQEFQIMEGHMGDYWNIANSAIDIRAYPSEGKMNNIASVSQSFLPFGAGSPDGFCMRSENHESRQGEWNTLDLICFDGKSIHIVNGEVVMVLQNSRYVENGKSIPLKKGRIQLQSEAAEVFYKDIQIINLTTLPSQYASLF
jgi:hypothetical protein